MMSNNKILTVSYGTFSCTLEGFDDSFGTMKAIAEYFRDLAADDRYFGAEPPQPDAELLARIAEREIARQVEVHASDKGIHLRTRTDAALPDAAPAPALSQDAEPAEPRERMPEASAEANPDTAAPDTGYPDDSKAERDASDAGDDESPASEDSGTPNLETVSAAPERPRDPADAADIETTAGTGAAPAQDDASIAILSPYIIQASLSYGALTTVEKDDVAKPGNAHSTAAANTEPGKDHEGEDGPATDTASADPTAEDPESTFPVAEDIAPVQAHPAPNSIAEKLQRIRAVVSKTHASDSAFSEDEHAGQILDHGDADNVTRIAEFFKKGPHAPAEDREEIAEPQATEKRDRQLHDAPAESAPEQVQTEPDMGAEAEAAPPSEPDKHAEADLPGTGIPEDVDDDAPADAHLAHADTDSAWDEEPRTEPAAPDAPELSSEDDLTEDAREEVQDDLSAALARLTEDCEDDEQADAVAASPEADRSPTAEDTGETEAGATEADQDDDVSSLFADLEDESEAGTEPSSDVDAEIAAEEAGAPDTYEPAIRARVIKVKRAEIVAALESGVLEESASDDAADETDIDPDEDRDDEASSRGVFYGAKPEDTGSADTRLDADEPGEADDDDAAAAEAAHTDPAEASDDAPGARTVKTIAESDERELDRLMAEADQQMQEPEGTRSRAAFSHLRAAVAATRADENLSTENETDETGYRTDLAAAVKPRRPVVGDGGRSDRPRDQRPAPLKLVAEQRIDLPAARTGPVRPRRVAAEAEPEEDGDSARGFADYAEARGAHELPDLLEAAASYLSFVEGRDQFSRPQLMTKVRQLDPEGFSREDGLRHFGQLLRSGKIEKIKGGNFTVSDEIGFRPDGERAAG